MWLRAMGKLHRALRRYRNDQDLDAVLRLDWESAPALRDFFSDIEGRLHGEEIARLHQEGERLLGEWTELSEELEQEE